MGNQFSYKIITPDGTTFSLNPKDYAVDVEMDAGLGLPPVEHSAQVIYNQPGALLRSIQIKPRVITITLALNSECRSELHSIRASLWNALRWNRTTDDPPAHSILRYESDYNQSDLHVYYAGDIFANSLDSDKVGREGIKLIAYDPVWYSTTDLQQALTLEWSQNVSYIAGKLSGEWSAMGNAGTGTVYALALSLDGSTLYVAGDFDNWNGIANADNIVSYNIGTAAWAALSTGIDGPVFSLAIAPDGTLYASGQFATAGGVACANIAAWNGAAWSALGAGLAGGLTTIGFSLAIAADGGVYVAGEFATANGVACANIARWNGATFTALGTGLDDIGAALAVSKNNDLYVTGQFTDAGGVADTRGVARWDGTTWHALSTGLAGGLAVGNSIAVAQDNSVYVGGQFTTAGGVAASNIARWNGFRFIALGSGLNNLASSLVVDSDGTLLAGGFFTTAGGLALAQRAARWNGMTWLPLDIEFPGAPTVYALLARSGNLFFGFDTAGVASASETTVVPFDGDAECFPTIEITGPGTLRWVENIHSGKRMIFDCFINDGETVTLDLSPGVKSFTSDWRGNMFPYSSMLPASDFATFAIEPAPIALNGDNGINVLMTGTTGDSSMTVVYRNVFLSADLAVA